MTEETQIIIDFDSTFIKVETLDELALMCLHGRKDKNDLIKKIKDITDKAMNGEMSFAKALQERLKILQPTKLDCEKVAKKLKLKISDSIKRNKGFFQKHAKNIYILSGGFTDIIYSVVKDFDISKDNIFANDLIFDVSGQFVKLDQNNLLSQDEGKVKKIKSVNLKGKIYVIGDGYTDYEIKKAGLADRFFVFTENVKRENVIKKADKILPNFDEFLYEFGLPMSISYPKNRIKVLLLENIHKEAVYLFEEEGYQVKVLSKALNEDDLISEIKDVSILGIRSKTKITEKVLQSANKLIAIGAFCVGTNQIDLKACTKSGIAVFNAPYANTRSVVELAMANILSLVRKIPERNKEMHSGIWNKISKDCFELRGKKLGIVGYGNIGSQLSILAEIFGMEVYYYDIVEKLALSNAKKISSLKELLKKVDVLSLHVDGNVNNKNLISEAEFKAMQNGMILVNLSRGSVVDLTALAKYLKNGKVQGAAIDVFPKEPEENGDYFRSELQNFDNVILTPHIAGSTEEAQKNIADFVPRQIVEYVNSGKSFLSVNMPEIQLPQVDKAHRFIHIHANVPGIMGKLNNIFAANNINILGQYLKTNDLIGYVITDVATKYNKNVINDLKNIDNTIKFRVLY